MTKQIGRPTKYTKDLANTICERLAVGESLRTICKDESMPHISNVMRWITSDSEVYKGFREQYAWARRVQAEMMEDDLLDIADDGSNDWMLRNDEDNPAYVINGEAIARSRLRVDTRKWYMSKVLPKFKEATEKGSTDTEQQTLDALSKLIDKLPN